MTQNFKPSQWDELNGSHTVKLPYSGGSFAEISAGVQRAIEYNPNLKTVIWCVDYDSFNHLYDYQAYSGQPEYLYDDNLFNDVSYIFNKSIFYKGILCNLQMTFRGEDSTSMDDYSSWNHGNGKETVFSNYERTDKGLDWYKLPENIDDIVKENIQKNFVDVIKANPEVEFILYYPPYNILFWDDINKKGWMDNQFHMESMVTKMLLECDNVKLYSFFENHEMIEDFNNYADPQHYDANINEDILNWIYNDDYRVGINNYQEIIDQNHKYYGEYDYEKLF